MTARPRSATGYLMSDTSSAEPLLLPFGEARTLSSSGSAVARPRTKPAQFHLTRGDAVTWLRSLRSGSVDLAITDPPYESLEKHRAVGTTTRLKHSKSSSNDWFHIFPNLRFPELFAEVHRVLSKDAHFYLFCDQETMFAAKPAAEAAGFKFWKPLVWDKRKIGMGYHYRSRYELILFFEKGKRKLHDLGIADVIECPRISGGYPAEKPPQVARVLIEQSSSPGQLVIDPFMGSGSTGVAATGLGRNFLGNDLSQTAFELTDQRLREVARNSPDLLESLARP
jgi:site-specific DNA-methyltransferase (adenine-specific)